MSECENYETKAESGQQSFKNETKKDLELKIRMHDNIGGRTAGKMTLVGAIVMLVSGVSLLVLELLFPSEEDSVLYPAIVICVLGVLFVCFALAFKPIRKAILKGNMQGKESTNAYTFTEEGCEVVTRMNDGTEITASGNYDGFTEVKEYKDMWLLYIDRETMFPIAKDGMKEGSAEELSALLSRTMGKRYKVCYKR